MSLEKPAKRAPAPRRPIARTSRLPRASKPLARKTRPRKQAKASRKKLARYADSLWSQIVRRREGGCVSGRPNHAGGFQAAHGFSRRYHATRYNLLNGHLLCAGCHVFYTHRPLEWDEWLRRKHGVFYEPLRLEALANEKQDLPQIVAALEAVLHTDAADPGVNVEQRRCA